VSDKKKVVLIGESAHAKAVASMVKHAAPAKSPKAVELVNELKNAQARLRLSDYDHEDTIKVIGKAVNVVDDIDAAFAHAFCEGFDAAVQMLSGHHANITHPSYIAQRTQELEDWQERNRKQTS
jgi:4-hydroxy-3-methylbut-2-enyl diphosphate reductase IspH